MILFTRSLQSKSSVSTDGSTSMSKVIESLGEAYKILWNEEVLEKEEVKNAESLLQ